MYAFSEPYWDTMIRWLLTQSFRFGPEIAYVGATILEVGKSVKKTMVGGNQQGAFLQWTHTWFSTKVYMTGDAQYRSSLEPLHPSCVCFIGSVRGEDEEMQHRFLTAMGGADGKLAVLSRTNASIFHETVRLTRLNSTVRVYIIGVSQPRKESLRTQWSLRALLKQEITEGQHG